MGSRIWSILAGLVLVLAACGDDRKKSENGHPQLRVSLPGSATGTLPVRVEVLGARTGDTLYVIARGPGEGVAGDGTRFVHTGVLAAAGAERWLGPDNTWSDTPVAAQPLALGASMIELAPPLPTPEEGSWAVRVEIRDANGLDVAFAVEHTLVSSKPALALAIDRLWAMGDERIRADVRVAAAGRDVGVVAWLTHADGREFPLPDLADPIALAPIDGRVQLLSQSLGGYGVGTYRIGARLVDRATGAYLAAAGAGFTICDSRGRVTGVVRNESGDPLGANAATAKVSLVSLSRGIVETTSVDLDADGGFVIDDVPVGRWHVDSFVIDGAGTHASDKLAIQVGCEGPTTVDLTAKLMSSESAATRVGHARVRPDVPTTMNGCYDDSKVSVRIHVDQGVIPVPEVDVTQVEKLLRTRFEAAGLRPIIKEDVAKALGYVMETQLVGADTPEHLAEVTNAVGNVDYIFHLTYTRVGEKRIVHGVFVKVRDAIALSAHQVNFDHQGEMTRDQWYDGVPGQIGLGDLATHLAVARGTSLDPKIELTYSPLVPRKAGALSPAALLRFQTVITDRYTCRAAAKDLPVELGFNEADGDTFPEVQLAQRVTLTDSSGIARHEMTKAPTADLITGRAYLKADGREFQTELIQIRYQQPGNLFYQLQRVRLPPLSKIKATIMTANWKFTDIPGGFELELQPLRNVTLRSKNATMVAATPATPSEEIQLKTDMFARASFEIIAGAEPGAAEIEGVVEGTTQVVKMTVWVEPPLAVAVSALPRSQVLANDQLVVEAFVDLPNGEKGVGIDVKFEVVSGGGTIETVIGKSNADGRATAIYRAPALPGAVVVRASAKLDGHTAQGDTNITVRPPCASCPVNISSDRTSCAKGGKILFDANQIVTWSAQGGTISNNGVYTCGQMGGEFTITASSVENPGTQGTRKIMIIPSAAEFAMAAMGKAVMQNVVADPTYCVASGMSTGSITITDLPPPAADDQVEIEYAFDGDCSERFGPGVQLAPRINSDSGVISQSFVDNITGCPIFSISVVPVGPGLSGFAGSVFLGNGQLVNGNFVCTTRVTAQFGP